MADQNSTLPPSIEEVAAGLNYTLPISQAGIVPPGTMEAQNLQQETDAARRGTLKAAPWANWNLTKDVAQNTITGELMAKYMTPFYGPNSPIYNPDPGFTREAYEARLKEAQKLLPEEEWPALDGAMSDAHFSWLLTLAKQRVERRQRIADYGTDGTVANVVAQFLDPATLAIGIGSGMIGNGLSVGYRLGRGGSIVANAAAGAAGGAGTEALRSVVQPVTSSDYLLAASIGLFLGGVVGVHGPGEAAERGAFLRYSQKLREMAENGLERVRSGTTKAAVKRAEDAVHPELRKPANPEVAPNPGEVQNTRGQTKHLDENGWPKGTEAWAEPSAPAPAAATTAAPPAPRPAPELDISKLTDVQLKDELRKALEATGGRLNEFLDWTRARMERHLQAILKPAQQAAPEAAPAAAPPRPALVQIEDTPADLKRFGERHVARYRGADDGEYFIQAMPPPKGEPVDMSGPYVLIRRDDKGAKTVAKNIDTIEEAKALIPKGDAPAPAAAEVPGLSPEAAADAGAAANPAPVQDFLQNMDWKAVKDEDVAYTAMGKARYDRAALLGRSVNTVARAIGNLLLNDTVGKVAHRLNPFSADLDQIRIQNTYMGAYNRVKRDALKDWADSIGLRPWERMTRAGEFYEQVGRYVAERGSRIEGPVHPAVKKLGDHVRTVLNEFREDMKNPLRREGLQGRPLKGAENLEENERYLWRKFRHDRVRDAVRNYGQQNVENVIRGAIMSAQEDIPEELATRIARGYLKGIHERSVGIGDDWSIALGTDNRAKLAALLREDAQLTDAEIDSLLTRLYQGKQTQGDTTNLKRRILLDESYIDPKSGLAFNDLLEHNVDVLMEGYMRRMSGRLALARVRMHLPAREGFDTKVSVGANGDTVIEHIPNPSKTEPGSVLVNGITSDAEMEALLRYAKEYGGDLQMRTPHVYTAENLESDIKQLQFAFDRIRAIPDPEQMKNYAQWLRRFRAYNVMTKMGQVGFAQLGELGQAVGSLGLKAVWGHVPGFRRVVDAASGERKLVKQLYAEIENMGIGVERLHGFYFHNLDEVGELPFTPTRNPAMRRADELLKGGERATFEFSGMSLIQQQQERFVAAAMLQKIAHMAERVKAGKGIGEGHRRRLAQLGIDELMMQRIFGEFRHADFKDGLFFDRKLMALNMDRWTDLEARAALENAIIRNTRKMIQAQDVGAAAVWMSNPLGQTIFQFRGFGFTAYNNQFLYNIHMGDMAAFNAMTWSVAWNAAVRALQIQALAVGRSDKERYLEKNLSTAELAKAGFQRSGWSSILPMIVDTGLVYGAGQAGIFNARSSGQPSDIILGNPTAGLLDNIGKGFGGLVGSTIEGRKMSQAEWRALSGLVPGGNLPGTTQMLNYLIQDAPERAPRKRPIF